jgi:7-cyano-7-deazaguanine synthase
MSSVLIFSGGLDSTVLLYQLLNEGKDVYPITFHYGQRHSIEESYAEKTVYKLGLQDKHRLIHLPVLEGMPSSQTCNEIDVPEGHYAEENMRKTVVPNRNMVMLASAASIAISFKCSELCYGAHQGDHAVYPDCRPDFVFAMQQALFLCDWHPLELVVPFLHKMKSEIVSIGAKLNVPFEDTRSCYKADAIACGRCGACCERKISFNEVGVEDPIQYADSEYWKSVAA